ncbi:MAG: hypothetical protein IKT27_02970 [Clostridia bacterium]|nr:hypothetical protein [Clostridia bacterium]
MINADMRPYIYYTFGVKNEYGQKTLSTNPVGVIKISINTISQALSDNVNYKQATYIGLTRDANVNDAYVIDYEGTKLKVLYVNPKGRLKQVFMGEM